MNGLKSANSTREATCSGFRNLLFLSLTVKGLVMRFSASFGGHLELLHLPTSCLRIRFA